MVLDIFIGLQVVRRAVVCFPVLHTDNPGVASEYVFKVIRVINRPQVGRTGVAPEALVEIAVVGIAAVPLGQEGLIYRFNEVIDAEIVFLSADGYPQSRRANPGGINAGTPHHLIAVYLPYLGGVPDPGNRIVGIHPELKLAQLGEPPLVPVLPFRCAFYLVEHLIELNLEVGLVEVALGVLRVGSIDVPLGPKADLPNDGISRRTLVDKGRFSVVTCQRTLVRVGPGVGTHIPQQTAPFRIGDDYLDVVKRADGE